jgi:hypothetical protein
MIFFSTDCKINSFGLIYDRRVHKTIHRDETAWSQLPLDQTHPTIYRNKQKSQDGGIGIRRFAFFEEVGVFFVDRLELHSLIDDDRIFINEGDVGRNVFFVDTQETAIVAGLG